MPQPNGYGLSAAGFPGSDISARSSHEILPAPQGSVSLPVPYSDPRTGRRPALLASVRIQERAPQPNGYGISAAGFPGSDIPAGSAHEILPAPRGSFSQPVPYSDHSDSYSDPRTGRRPALLASVRIQERAPQPNGYGISAAGFPGSDIAAGSAHEILPAPRASPHKGRPQVPGGPRRDGPQLAHEFGDSGELGATHLGDVDPRPSESAQQ